MIWCVPSSCPALLEDTGLTRWARDAPHRDDLHGRTGTRPAEDNFDGLLRTAKAQQMR